MDVPGPPRPAAARRGARRLTAPEAPRDGAPPLRLLLGAFGDPGHAFPMLALGAGLVRRGHDVRLQTWRRWREPAEALGIGFEPAPEYQVFPTRERPLKPYEAAVRAAHDTVPLVREFAPHAVVADILTVAPALAADVCAVPWATLVPHLFPAMERGFPAYSIGARIPRTPAGRALWCVADRAVQAGLELGRRQYNEARRRLGLGPLPWVHTGLSRSLTLVATFPELEYPRAWPDWSRVVGPLLWEPPGDGIEPPPGDGPVVLVAPSTSQDPGHTLVRAALEGLRDEPVRVLASTGRPPDPPIDVPANAILVDWLSYGETMPACDLVVTHGGHGTLALALTHGCTVMVCPAAGDMAENAARVDWARVGVRLPRRLLSPRTLRLAVRRALADDERRARARALAAAAALRDGPLVAAREVERWARRAVAGRAP